MVGWSTTGRGEVLDAIRKTLSAELACDQSSLGDDGIIFSPYQELSGGRRFRPSANPLLILTMGAGVVVTANPERLAWLREQLGSLKRDEVFSAMTIARLVEHCEDYQQNVYGPDIKYACSQADLRMSISPDSTAIRLLEGDDVLTLYEHPGFVNALQYDANHQCPDVLATVAMVDDEVVGMAGASADSDALWQIGVDVVPAAQNKGLGKALVSKLTAAILAHSRVPYYSTSPSNIRSRALAGSVGFWPAWTELRVMDR